MPEALIQVEGLTKYYDERPAIQDVTFSVPRGQVLGLLGPKGAGKSTILRILAGYVGPTAGRASIAGFDVFDKWRQARRHVGYLPQNSPLYDDMRVERFLELLSRLRGVAPSKRRGLVGGAIEACGLSDRRSEIIGRLAPPQRRRVALAQTVVHDPDALILDEPYGGLDAGEARKTRGLIKELGRARTVIVSSHILPELSAACDRILTLDAGRLVVDDTPAGLIERIAGGRGHEIEILVRGDATKLEAVLRGVEGVDHVVVTPADDDLTRAVVTASDADLREELGRIVVEAGLGLRELHARSLSTQDVLRALTTDEPA